MPTFDIVNKIDYEAFKNAVDGVNREISVRYDFKGSISKIVSEEDNYYILAESDMKLNQIKELLTKNLVRKNVNVKSINFEDIEKVSGGNLKLPLILSQGISKENAQKIIKYLKNQKFKIQVSILGDQLRVSGKKRDDLQVVISKLKELDISIPLNFINFRDQPINFYFDVNQLVD